MKIKEIKKVTNYKHLNMFEISYVDRLGNKKQWQMVSRRDAPKCHTSDFAKPDAVIIVPFHKEKRKLAIIKEFRVILGGYQIGFPAGLVDAGETIEEASLRELKEETGLSIIQFTQQSPPVFSSSGLTDEAVTIVYVECGGEPSYELNEASEDISVIFVSQKEAADLCANYQMKIDVKTWLVLNAFAKSGDPWK